MKASQLVAGQYIRDPGQYDRILLVVNVGSEIKCTGYNMNTDETYWFSCNDEVTQVNV